MHSLVPRLETRDEVFEAVATVMLDGRPHAVTTGGDDRTVRVWELEV